MELDHEFTVPVPVDRAWPVLLDVERIAPCMPGATLDSIDGDEFTGRLRVRLGAMTITYKGSARIAAKDEQARTVTIEGSGKEARGSGTASATVHARLHEDGEHTRVTVHTKLNVTGRPAQFGRGILSEVGGKLVKRFADNLAAELTGSGGTAAGAGAAAGAGTGTRAGTGATAASSAGAAASGATAAAGASAAAGSKSTTPAAAETGTGGPAEAGKPTEPEKATGGEKPAEAEKPAAGEKAPAEAGAAAPADAGEATETGTPAATGAAEGATAPARRRPEDEAVDLLEVAGPAVAKRAAPAVGALVVFGVVWRLIRRRRRRR